jgi:UTP:GlnB (protein PII) uridylyltransferase
VKGYEGPVAVCSARYVAVAGHRPDRPATKFMENNKEMEVWLAPVSESRITVPLRISVATMVGTTVIEATGRDRPGLLSALAEVIADAGLSIVSAHIDGYGERAVDAFYVVDAQGRKLEDPALVSRLRTDMTAALEVAEGEGPSRNRAHLQRARASVAR